jgi:cold-inducible RNA-binding protein
MSKKLFVGNVSMKTTEDELYRLFSQVGQVVHVFSPKDLKTGYRPSYCFIDVETSEDGQKVIDRFDGYLLNNNLLIVSDAFPTQARPNPGIDHDITYGVPAY